MSLVIATAVWETLWYVGAGGPLTAVAFLIAGTLASPCALALGWGRSRALLRRAALFVTLLFLCGAPGNVAFTLFMRGRYYHAADPVVDWLPWLPSAAWALDAACGGHYLQGASASSVRLAWLVVAIPVWSAAILLFRWVTGPRANEA
jgi:hypothetical protein